MRIVTLFHKDGSDAFAPDVLNRRQNPNFIVDQNVVVRRISLCDILKFQFFMDIDQDGSRKSIIQSGPPNLMRLKDDVSIGENYRHCVLLNAFDYFERIKEESLFEWIV